MDHELHHDQRITKTAAQQTLKELNCGSPPRRAPELVRKSIGGFSGAGDHTVDDFLFNQKSGKGGLKYGPTQGPHFILDGQPGQDHAVVEMTKLTPEGLSGMGQYGVL